MTRHVLPGLVDVHVHLRVPGGEHKETVATGTAAALAGGVTAVLAMPNTAPPITDGEALADARRRHAGALCDVGVFLGATDANAAAVAAAAGDACGLKIYVNETYGPLRIETLPALAAHFAAWPRGKPIVLHAEEVAVATAIGLGATYGQRVHIAHVSRAEEIALIADAKAAGLAVTCEVAPHHLFLTADDLPALGPFGLMRPPLARPADRDALWAHLDAVDCIATDHAPHTLEEKRSARPPMGVPGLETMLPLLLTLALGGRPGESSAHGHLPASAALRLEDIARLCCEGPARAFGIARKGRIASGFDADLVLVDPRAEWTIGDRPLHTKCGWTPFAGWRARGAVERVFLRGRLAFERGRVLLERGSGRRIGDA